MTHEHEFESAPGLPAPLPPGERVVWRGSPDLRSLALRVFHVRKAAIYFAVLIGWRAIAVHADGGSAPDALVSALILLPFALFALALLGTLAWLTSRLTVYTITDRRVVMRLGIVLTVTFNLPFRRIASAGLRLYRDGTGDLPLVLAGTDRIAYAHLWPHARPWHYARTEPMLRCVPDAAHVARMLADALATSAGTPPRDLRPAAATPEAPAHPESLPAAA